ncbi:MAG: hypothetical protein ABJM58_12210 [Alteripontixanthobacter sp.]
MTDVPTEHVSDKLTRRIAVIEGKRAKAKKAARWTNYDLVVADVIVFFLVGTAIYAANVYPDNAEAIAAALAIFGVLAPLAGWTRWGKKFNVSQNMLFWAISALFLIGSAVIAFY